MNQCPKCGHFLPSPRAPIGEGTQAAKDLKKLNPNLLAIGRILFDSDKPLVVQEVQRLLYDKGIKRHDRGQKIATGGWDRHEVQVDLSRLVGAELTTMTRAEEFVDDYGHGARPIPHYFMTLEQKERFKEIQVRNGAIKFSLVTVCPKCGCPVK